MTQPKAVETSQEALTTSELAMRFWRNRKHVVSASTGDDLVLMVDAISFANECRQARLSPEAIPQNKREESVCNSLDDHTGAFATVDVAEFWHANFGTSNCDQCACEKFLAVYAAETAASNPERAPNDRQCAELAESLAFLRPREAATPSPAPDTCPHKTLKRQNVGNQRWYRCPECQQKFIASDWDGKVKVGAPSPAVSPKCIHGTEVWGCEFCHERSPAVSQPPQEEK